MRPVKLKNTICIGFFLLISIIPEIIEGYELPSLNLGFTNFLDGGPPAGPGLYFMQYVQYYRADKFSGKDGNNLNLPSPGGPVCPELDVWASLTEFVYVSDQEVFFGGKWGLGVIMPFVNLDLNQKDNFAIRDAKSGPGDLIVAPILQWDPVMFRNRPIYVQRFAATLLFPTGRYDDGKEINPGSNFFSFNPYWAATFFITPRLTASWRAQYLWNDKNDSPNQNLYPGAGDIRAGQAFHINFSAGFSLIPHRLHMGVNGFYLKQITDTKIDGRDISGTREQVFAIGPGGVYSFSKETHLFLGIYFESKAENRTEGKRFSARLVHHF